MGSFLAQQAPTLSKSGGNSAMLRGSPPAAYGQSFILNLEGPETALPASWNTWNPAGSNYTPKKPLF